MFTRGYTKHGLAIPMANMLYKNLTCFYQVMLGTPNLCCHCQISRQQCVCVLFQWRLNIKNGATMDEHINPFINHYIESLLFLALCLGTTWNPHIWVYVFFKKKSRQSTWLWSLLSIAPPRAAMEVSRLEPRNKKQIESSLVGGIPTPLKIWKSVGSTIPNIWKNKIHVPNHQPENIGN